MRQFHKYLAYGDTLMLGNDDQFDQKCDSLRRPPAANTFYDFLE